EAPRAPEADQERQRDRLPAVQHHPDQSAHQSVDRGQAAVKTPPEMRNAERGMRNASRIQHLFRIPRSAFRIATAALAFSAAAGAQSLTYTRGQNVAPAYEGWEQDADGVKYFLFGYMNRNWEQELDVPVGPDNSFNIGGADQGQPTHFLPRRNRFVFRVRVPNGFSDKDELVWT